MDTARTSIIDYGVDYITVTATVPPRTKSLIDVAKENLQAEVNAGNEVREWRGLGYHGLTSGGASYGVGPQGVIARLTSGTAREGWRTLFSWGSKCTRLDLQLTVREPRLSTEVIGSQWENVLAWWNKSKGRAEPKLFVGPRGPESISVGSRQSDSCGRIYDKGVESKLEYYQNAVRYEVEFKGQRSNVLTSILVGQPRELAHVEPHVSRFFRKRHVSIPVCPGEELRILLPAPESDCTRKLAYLRKSVNPMIKFLISQGRIAEVIEALELRPFVDAS
jgi:hypothetical protein